MLFITYYMDRIEKVRFRTKVLRIFWNISYLLLIYPFRTRFFRIWRILVIKLWGAKVSWSSSIYATTKIWAPWNLVMEEYAGIGPNVIIYNQAKVKIGKYSKISQYSYLCTAGHDITILNNSRNGLIIAPIVIEDKVWIGAKSYIGMGVKIGIGSVVGATASVYKDVNPWVVVGGNPAKEIKKRILRNEVDEK